MKTLVVILLCAGFLSSTSQAQWGALVRTTTTAATPTKGETTTGLNSLVEYPTKATDEKILNQLNSLIKESGWYSTLTLRVNDGIVTLEGTTKSRDHLRVLIDAAQRLPHTVAVVNKVEVQPPVIDNLDPVVAELREFAVRTWQFLPLLLIAIMILGGLIFFGRYLNRGVRNAWKWRIKNPFLLALVSRLTLVPIWVMIFYFALRLVGIPNVGATIIGGTGFLTLLIALAFKGIAENYLAGILLASRSPFTKGDLIQVGAYQGYVQNLNMRGTTIIDLNGNLILIPNIMVIQSVVENRTANPSMRTSFYVSIAYHESIARVQELIVEGLSEVRGILKDPAPNVVVESLDPSSVKLRVQVWLDAKDNTEARVKSRAMIRTKDTLLVNGISIPDEAREVVFADSLKVHVMNEKEASKASPQERKDEMQRAGAYNLEDSKKERIAPDVRQEKLMDLAEKNPLPMNKDSSDLLKKSDDVTSTEKNTGNKS